MTIKFAAAMRRATAATRAFNILGATRLIQKTLTNSMLSGALRQSSKSPTVAVPRKQQKAQLRYSEKSGATGPSAEKQASPVPSLPGSGSLIRFGLAKRSTPLLPIPDGASFALRRFTSKAGVREFKLYVPASASKKPRGLILMLHGCTQNPDDFAAGTNMNAVAEAHGLLVAYPHQTRASNASACWNWFEEAHQRRDMGEPGILAGLTRKLISEFGIEKTQVFVAGLSAGAAMAVILAKTYPDVFRAVGVHSGLAYQSAGNVMSAMAVMRGHSGSRQAGKAQVQDASTEPVRTIIFHGSADRTVNPSNAQHILDTAHGAIDQQASVTSSGTSNGRRFTRTVMSRKDGTPIIENWLIDGAGHTWSGGHTSGSYADAKGPDASAEMVRFFLTSR